MGLHGCPPGDHAVIGQPLPDAECSVHRAYCGKRTEHGLLSQGCVSLSIQLTFLIASSIQPVQVACCGDHCRPACERPGQKRPA